MKKDTYSAYERELGASKTIRLTAEKAMQFARKLKVRWEWLLEGKGLPWPEDTEASRARPGAQAQELVDSIDDPDLQQRAVQMLRVLTGRTGTDG